MDQQKNIEPTDTFDENPGIRQRFIPSYSDSDLDTELPPVQEPDPVLEYKHEVRHPPKTKPPKPKVEREVVIEPSVSTRIGLDTAPVGEAGAKFIAPMPTIPKGYEQRAHLQRMEFYKRVEFCDENVFRMPSPIILDTISKTEEESPTVSKAKVIPARPTPMTSSQILPPTKSELKAREIKSGVFLNVVHESEESASDAESEIERRNKPKRIRIVKRRRPHPELEQPHSIHTLEDDEEQRFLEALALSYMEELDGEGEEEIYKVPMIDRSTHVSDNLILGPFADQMSAASSATSMAGKSEYDDLSWCEIPITSRLVQTLRDGQCEKPKRKYRKGCFENHSLMKIKQKIVTDFPHCTIAGTININDLCFPKISRGNQGICIPIAAFCYAHLQRCKQWTPRSIDEILELGNLHFLESIAELHLHKGRKELTAKEVNNFFFVCDKKVKFELMEPEVKGLSRSTNPKIFNITTGLHVFFCDFNAGILRTEQLNVLVWRIKKGCYLFFDGNARRRNLVQDKQGTAVMTVVPKVEAIASILLDRSNIGNSPFNISQIKILKIMGKDEREEDQYAKDRNTYIAMNERQAIVQATFDLGDYCFLFNRNKQSMSMSIIAMAYSRVSAPDCWHKKTLDKIMIIGNQLHSIIVEAECCPDPNIEHLPAVFTVGPYVVEIHIYPNRYADLMYKKSNCMFAEDLKLFFESNHNCLAQIGKCYLAIWMQRDMFFCFDPFTRNKEGLKCRKGVACCSMNKDLDALLETVTQNFDNRDIIFHLHALKLLRIHRDPDLSKYFPKHLPLQEVPVEIFHQHKCLKSKKRATEKPFATSDFKQHALKKLLAGMVPGESVMEVQSNLDSIDTRMLGQADDPKLMKVPKPKKRDPVDDLIIDLDSPSLSDTQIVPKRPSPYDDEINIDDLASFGLTQEEKEILEVPEGGEGEGEGAIGPAIYSAIAEDGFFGEEEESDHYGVKSQVMSDELDPCFRTDYINTDLTYCYKLLPAMELPMWTKGDHEAIIDPREQDKELENLRSFKKINEEMQIILAKVHAFDFIADDDDPNLIVPYICIMAAAYDLEKPVFRWDDFVLRLILNGGRSLYEQYAESFVHIDDFKFEFKKNTVMATIHIIFNTYIGDDLFETFSGQQILEEYIRKHVLSRQDVGFIIVPHYACTVFFKHSLYYLFDPYNCNKYGNAQRKGKKGGACVMRFRTIQDLVQRLIENLTKHVRENEDSGMQFRMLMLAKPKLSIVREEEDEVPPDEALQQTVSDEFKLASNYIKLPDGSQLVRGTKHVGDVGVEVEYIAPYICIMAATVAYKYSMRTWSTDVVDFVMQAGDALYRKAHYTFMQLAKLDIPHITLGQDHFTCHVRYVFDSPCNVRIMQAAINRIVHAEKDWVFIVTEVYTCAVCQRHKIYYLYNPFACNELGLDDPNGFAAVARFRTLDQLCWRIMFTKGKRDLPEHGEYTRFALYVCRISYRPKSFTKRMKYPGGYEKELATYGGAEGGEDEEEKEEVPRVRHGYYKVTNVEVLEGSKALPRPPGDQEDLTVDHFTALAASLMVIHKPLDDWSTKTVDRTISVGQQIYDHADSLEHSKRRAIRNILVGKYFFDVIVNSVEIGGRCSRSFKQAWKFVMRRRKFIILETGEGTYAIYVDTDNNLVHLYHPYEATFKQKDQPDEDVANACWIKFRNVRQMRRFLKDNNNLNRFKFYTFNVTNVTQAPRSVIVSTMIQDWIRAKQIKGEIAGKTFHEHESWMDLHDNPWAKLGGGVPQRGTHNKWYAWEIEYNNDLYILCGTMNLYDKCFKLEWRGKQVLATLVTVIGMTGIYDLKEWNATVLDAVLISGYKYFLKCAERIDDENHEFGMDDLLDECEIFPFSFKVRHQQVIEGTMFLTSLKRYDLYRSLRYFFDEYYYRAGIIIAEKEGVKKMVAFAKRKDNEYYMCDCNTFGKPMFAPHEGVAYMLRCTTLARLIHVLVLTLRGGEFFIYEVIADNFSAIQGDLNPYVDEKPKLKP